jgi:hypothetical protein
VADISGCKGQLGFGNIANNKQTVFSIITYIKLLCCLQLLKDHFKTLPCNCSQIFFGWWREGEDFQDMPQGINLMYSLPYSILQ